MFAGDINTLFTSARVVLFQLSAPMNATVMAGGSRDRGRCILTRLLHGFILVFLVLCWLGSGSASSKPPSTSPTPTTAFGSRLIACVFGLRHISPVVYFVIHKGVVSAVMPRLPQRILSHGGTSRGAPSHPSSSDATSSEHPHSRSRRRSILRPSQFLEPSCPRSSSLPSFGSAIFTFNFSLNRPWIISRVSVLFLEVAQEDGESSVIREDHGTVPMPIAGSSRDMSTLACHVNDIMMELASLVSTASEEDQAYDLVDGGWCRIVEETPDV